MPTVKQPDECIDYYEFCEQQLADVAAGKVELSKFAEANMRRRLHDKPYSVIDVRLKNSVAEDSFLRFDRSIRSVNF